MPLERPVGQPRHLELLGVAPPRQLRRFPRGDEPASHPTGEERGHPRVLARQLALQRGTIDLGYNGIRRQQRLLCLEALHHVLVDAAEEMVTETIKEATVDPRLRTLQVLTLSAPACLPLLNRLRHVLPRVTPFHPH